MRPQLPTGTGVGPVRSVTYLAVTAGLTALFGRRDKHGVHGEVTGSWSAPPPVPAPPAQAVPDPSTEVGSRGPTEVDSAPERGSRGLRPVPHPIRPWELWHPAAEPVHLFRHDVEERVSWNDMSDGNDPAIDGDAWVQPDVGPDHGDSGNDRFGFGRLRPFTGDVIDRADASPSPSSPSSDIDAVEAEGSVSVAPPEASPGGADTSSPDDGEGDVLFRNLLSPGRMTASEQALEDPPPAGSPGPLINGPVTRRSGWDQDRGRRRLPAGLRVFGGGADGHGVA